MDMRGDFTYLSYLFSISSPSILAFVLGELTFICASLRDYGFQVSALLFDGALASGGREDDPDRVRSMAAAKFGVEINTKLLRAGGESGSIADGATFVERPMSSLVSHRASGGIMPPPLPGQSSGVHPPHVIKGDSDAGVFGRLTDVESPMSHAQERAPESELTFGAISHDGGGLSLRGVSMSDSTGSLTSGFESESFAGIKRVDYACSVKSEADYARFAQHI